MNYRERRTQECLKLFENFQLDLTRCHKPEIVKEVLNLTAQGYFSKEIAEKMGISAKAVQKIARRYNFPNLHNFCPPIREERPNWNGGTKLMKGYIYVRTPDHPHSTTHGNYVALHRLVMEQTLNRYLLPTEVVDHIDGDILNNHPDNLRVFSSNAEHLRVTLKNRRPNWTEEGYKRICRKKKQSDQL